MCRENFYSDVVNVGESIKILRKRRGYTQSDLAKRAGIDRKHLSDLELGKHVAGMETSLMLCEALKINRFELLALAWEDEFKEFLQRLAKEKDKERCSQLLTKCLFFLVQCA